MSKILSYLCFFCAGILPLAAQTPPEREKRQGGGRTAWFACTSLPPGLEDPVKVMSGRDVTQLALPQFTASDPVKIPDDGILRIVREVPDPANQGRMKYLILAQAKIPETVREALVILGPLPKPEGDLLFSANVQDLASFKGGDRLYINLSTTQIRVHLGPTKVIVAPKQANIYSAPALTEAANVPIMYEFYHPEQEKWKMLSASTVVLRPTRREICIFNNGTRLGNIKKHAILFPVQNQSP